MDKHDNIQELKRKSLTGIGALVRRQVILKILFFIGNVILARLLAPQIFGVYAIVSFVVQFFSTFSDVGLGAALIQKKGELTREELSTTFWLQQALVWLVAGVAVALAPLALRIYPTLPPSGVWLIRAMAFSFLFSSLKSIPAILLERNLDFNRIAWVDIAENVAYQAAAIIFAVLGFGVWSFVFAAIIRGAFGAVVIYAVSTWRPSFNYSLDSVKALIKFGLPYQGNAILSFIKDAVTPLFVGAYAGAAAVGYVNWARSFAFAPLILSESFGRVAFPAFARIQHDKELLVKAIERSMRMITFVMFPTVAMMIALGPQIIHLIFTDKWLPGIYAFYLYCTSPGGTGIFLPLYSAILSLGKSRILLIMTLGLIAFEWGLGVPLVVYFGFTGVAMTQPATVIIFTYIYYLVLKKEEIKVQVIKNVTWQLISTLLTGLLVKLIVNYIRVNIYNFFVISFFGLILYVSFIYVLRRSLLKEFLEYSKSIVRRQNELA